MKRGNCTCGRNVSCDDEASFCPGCRLIHVLQDPDLEMPPTRAAELVDEYLDISNGRVAYKPKARTRAQSVGLFK